MLLKMQVLSLLLNSFAWWCHQMETFSALLAFCVGNSPVTGEFPSQRPVTQSLNVFFYICAWINVWVNNREAGDLRRHRSHYDVIVMAPVPRSCHGGTYIVTDGTAGCCNDSLWCNQWCMANFSKLATPPIRENVASIFTDGLLLGSLLLIGRICSWWRHQMDMDEFSV